MKNEIKGLVMDIEQNHCIIMTHEGEFRRVGRPSGQVEVGQELTAYTSVWSDRLRPLALVASLLLMVVAVWSVYQWNLPTVVAYVSLDINPSIELGINSQSRVVEANGLNEDGRKLLQVKPVMGKDIYAAMSELVAAAVEQHYINEQKENMVFTAIELEPQAPAQVVEEKQLYQAINKSLDSFKQPVSVQVTKAQPKARQEAHKLGVSTGRYLLIKEVVKEDKNIQPQDLVQKSLTELGVKQWIEKAQQQKGNNKVNWQIQQPQALGPQWTRSQWNRGKQAQQLPVLWTQWNGSNKQIQQPQVLWPQWNRGVQERSAKIKPKTERKDSTARYRQNDKGKRDKQNQSVNNGRSEKGSKESDNRYPVRNNNRPGQTDNDHRKDDRSGR